MQQGINSSSDTQWPMTTVEDRDDLHEDPEDLYEDHREHVLVVRWVWWP